MKKFEFYTKMNIHQKICFKEMVVDLCGIEWVSLGRIFTPRERMTLIYNKLKLEGFDV